MQRKIRILHVVPHMQIGGINRFVLDLVSYLKGNDTYEIGIYICSERNPTWKQSCEALGVQVFWDKLMGFDLNPAHYVKFVKIKNRYDIIHWHVFSPLLSLTCLYDKKIHVFTHHSVLGEGRISKRTDSLKWGLFKLFVTHRLNCEVYNSKFTQSFWQKRGFKAKTNRLIYNGAVFSDKTLETHLCENMRERLKNKFVVGTSSNLIGCKRVNLLIDAFKVFCAGKDDVILLIVGDGCKSQSLKFQAENLGIADKVIFVGHQAEVTRFQQAMDICVFPSTTETFGLAALECMFIGKPTLCMNDGGGICEVIGNDSNILPDMDSLIGRMEFYYRLSPDEYQTEAVEVHNRSKEFDMAITSKKYSQLYIDLCQYLS